MSDSELPDDPAITDHTGGDEHSTGRLVDKDNLPTGGGHTTSIPEDDEGEDDTSRGYIAAEQPSGIQADTDAHVHEDPSVPLPLHQPVISAVSQGEDPIPQMHLSKPRISGRKTKASTVNNF